MREQGGEDNQWATCEEFDARRILFATGELDPAEIGGSKRTFAALRVLQRGDEATDSELLRIVSEQHAEPDAAFWQRAGQIWWMHSTGKKKADGFGAHWAFLPISCFRRGRRSAQRYCLWLVFRWGCLGQSF